MKTQNAECRMPKDSAGCLQPDQTVATAMAAALKNPLIIGIFDIRSSTFDILRTLNPVSAILETDLARQERCSTPEDGVISPFRMEGRL